jgi:hypothetical protein
MCICEAAPFVLPNISGTTTKQIASQGAKKSPTGDHDFLLDDGTAENYSPVHLTNRHVQ